MAHFTLRCPGSLSGVSPMPGGSLPRNTNTSGSGAQQKLSPPTPFADISLGSDSVNCCFTNNSKEGPSSSSHKGPLDD